MSNRTLIKNKSSSGLEPDIYLNLVIDDMTQDREKKPNYPKKEPFNFFKETIDTVIKGNKSPFFGFWDSEKSYFKRMIEYGEIGMLNNSYVIKFDNYVLKLDIKKDITYDNGRKTLMTEYNGHWFKAEEEVLDKMDIMSKPTLLAVRIDDLPDYSFVTTQNNLKLVE